MVHVCLYDVGLLYSQWLVTEYLKGLLKSVELTSGGVKIVSVMALSQIKITKMLFIGSKGRGGEPTVSSSVQAGYENCNDDFSSHVQ